MLAVLKLPLTLIWTVPMLSTVAKTLLRWGIVRAVRAIQPWTFAAVIRAATAVILHVFPLLNYHSNNLVLLILNTRPKPRQSAGPSLRRMHPRCPLYVS